MGPPYPPPFPYYGGKRRVTDVVWEKFGRPRRYIEPFVGGSSMLLGRPSELQSGVEIINDKDGLLVNVWRAIQEEPGSVLEGLQRPGSTVDLHAASKKLREEQIDLTEKLRDDIHYYNVELASLWIWGRCYWKGASWPTDSRKRPHSSPEGILSPSYQGQRREWLQNLAGRLSDVTILCGDWKQTVRSKRAREGKAGRTPIAFFFDPPYEDNSRTDDLYHEDSKSIVREVKDWCLEYQDNKDYRIALCTFDNVDMPGWHEYQWSSRGTTSNKERERIWFSPHCQTEVGSKGMLGKLR